MHAAFVVLLSLVAQDASARTSLASPAAAVPSAAVPSPPAVVAVVCPEVFREAMTPWIEFRKSQGYDVRMLSSEGTPDEIRTRIRLAALSDRLKFLVLVGDVATGMDGKPVAGKVGNNPSPPAACCVPTPYAKAKVNVRWGSPPQMPNDAWYADVDDDRLPDVAQGRLTADTPEQLKTIVAKILTYERSTDFGPWRRQMNFVAGVGGFGPLADLAIESATRYVLTTCIPACYNVSMTQANWQAVYCPDPRRINDTTVERLNDGAMFWTYIGHGSPQRLGYMHVPGGRYPLLDTRDAGRLRADRGPSIALFLACYVGAIDSRSDCLAEELLRQPGGPVAVVASSRVAMPYAMAVMGTEMMDACFVRHAATLGEAVLAAKRGLVRAPELNEIRAKLDSIASFVSPSASQLEEERKEHIALFNLIGDPCLRLRHPQPVPLAIAIHDADLTKIAVEGTSPIAGRARFELVRPLGKLGFKPPQRTVYTDAEDALATYEQVYQKANDRRISDAGVQVRPGPFRAELAVPGDLTGTFLVQAFVEGKNGFASGAVGVDFVKGSLKPAMDAAGSRQ